MDECLSHLPRCIGASGTVTYSLDMETEGLIPIGHDVELKCIVPKAQPPEMLGSKQCYA
eukprot:CAMPEP_0180511704 /NCGR_PEP_ID=MMETSP1036_2-20121128/51173_1 /TAXON_ID=632150 /ORGANISM="Azadinium spinosum, Strain 3D9" /LENGTH=58 /DNA_ID=CAMNT_0022522747 /DNA_START=11 /DNA_END=183 /DNA_ORIENTATION=-